MMSRHDWRNHIYVMYLTSKVRTSISTVSFEVLGGGVIVMFGMVASAVFKMLSDVPILFSHNTERVKTYSFLKKYIYFKSKTSHLLRI